MILRKPADSEYPERHSVRHFARLQEIEERTVQVFRPRVSTERDGAVHSKKITLKHAILILSMILLVAILAVIVT